METAQGNVFGMRKQLAIAAGTAALWATRRYYRNWGATKEESRTPMNGDGYVHDPVAQTTVAEWIDAPVHVVWERMTESVCGGTRAVGDVVPLAVRIGTRWPAAIAMSVIELDERRAIVLRTAGAPLGVDATCEWQLEPRRRDRTRLVMRLRIGLRHPGDFLVAESCGPALALATRRVLDRIRRSAERQPLQVSA